MNKQQSAQLAHAATILVAPKPGDGTSLEERLQAVLDTEPSLAERYFALHIIKGVTEDDLDEALLTALGVDYSAPDTWPFKNTTYDYYDSSFELKHTREGWEPTADGLAKAWALGFSRAWVCYGGEKYGPDADSNYHEKYYTRSV